MTAIPSLGTTLLFSLATGLLSAYLSHRREKNPYLWFFIGFFFGLLGTLALFFTPKNKTQEEEIPEKFALKPEINGPLDKLWYYLDPTHTQIGPMSHTALTSDWRQGKLTAATLIWNEDLTEWKPLQEFITPQA